MRAETRVMIRAGQDPGGSGGSGGRQPPGREPLVAAPRRRRERSAPGWPTGLPAQRERACWRPRRRSGCGAGSGTNVPISSSCPMSYGRQGWYGNWGAGTDSPESGQGSGRDNRAAIPDTLEFYPTKAALPGQPTLGCNLHIRHVDAGSCNGCESELQALNNPFYNLPRPVARDLGGDGRAAPGDGGGHLRRLRRDRSGGICKRHRARRRAACRSLPARLPAQPGGDHCGDEPGRNVAAGRVRQRVVRVPERVPGLPPAGHGRAADPGAGDRVLRPARGGARGARTARSTGAGRERERRRLPR